MTPSAQSGSFGSGTVTPPETILVQTPSVPSEGGGGGGGVLFDGLGAGFGAGFGTGFGAGLAAGLGVECGVAAGLVVVRVDVVVRVECLLAGAEDEVERLLVRALATTFAFAAASPFAVAFAAALALTAAFAVLVAAGTFAAPVTLGAAEGEVTLDVADGVGRTTPPVPRGTSAVLVTGPQPDRAAVTARTMPASAARVLMLFMASMVRSW